MAVKINLVFVEAGLSKRQSWIEKQTQICKDKQKFLKKTMGKPKEAVPGQDPGEGGEEALKKDVIRFSGEHGADLIGFASPGRWDEAGEVAPDFRPKNIWPPVKTVISLGMQMLLPIVETTPSVEHMELYRTVNQALDRLAYDLTRYLNRRGYASLYFTHDGFGSIKDLRDRPIPFSHLMAAKYAGLGSIGLSHCLLTVEFGPRVRFVSVFTEAQIPADPVSDKELCIKCGLCATCCPKKALTVREDRIPGDYDVSACTAMAEALSRGRRFPCGVCTKVCPIGQDRLLYRQKVLRSKHVRDSKILETL